MEPEDIPLSTDVTPPVNPGADIEDIPLSTESRQPGLPVGWGRGPTAPTLDAGEAYTGDTPPLSPEQLEVMRADMKSMDRSSRLSPNRRPLEPGPSLDDVALIKQGLDAEARISEAQGKAGHDRPPGDVSLSENERKGLEFLKGIREDAAAAQQKATDEAGVPTALKLPLAGIKGVLSGLDEASKLAVGKGGTGWNPQQIPSVGGTAGAITESAAQFVTGFKGAGLFIKGGGLAVGMAKGAVADAAVFDAHEARLSNLLEEHFSLANPVTQFLASDPADSEAGGRFKNALEGVLLGAVVVSFVAAVRGIKSIRRARSSGGQDAAKVAAQVADELEVLQSSGRVVNLRAAPGKELKELPADAGDFMPQSLRETVVERLHAGTEGAPGLDIGRDFNFAKLKGGDDVRQAINLVSDAIAPEIHKLKGGIQTLRETEELADVLGTDPVNLMGAIAKDAVDASSQAARIRAGKTLMQSLASQISRESQAVDNGIRLPDRLGKLVGIMGELQMNLKASITGAARATSAGRIGVNVGDPMLVKALVMADGDPKAVAALTRPDGLYRRSLGAYSEFWINSLLSGPRTHLINGVSNLLHLGIRPVETMVGGGIRHGASEFVGMAMGLKDSVRMAAKSFMVDGSILDPMVSKVDTPRRLISGNNLSPDSPGMGLAWDYIGKVVNLPTRFLTTGDELFKQLAYRSSTYASATREGMKSGLKGKPLATYIEDRQAKSIGARGEATDLGALADARVATFTQPLESKIGQGIQQLARDVPELRLIAPFVRTPGNLIHATFRRIPGVNLLLQSYRADLAAGGVRAARARGQMATGLMFAGTAVVLAREGRITGRGPTDPKERATLEMTGWRPYSVKMEDGTFLEYGRLDPWGMQVGLMADMTEAYGYVDQDSWQEWGVAAGASIAKNLSSKTYLRGITEFLDALSQPDQRFKHWWNSRVGSHVPTGLQQVAGLAGYGDDTRRVVNDGWEALMARTPGLSDKLPPARNVLGEPIRWPAGLGSDAISPILMSKQLSDPGKLELARLERGFSLPPAKINNGRIDLTQFATQRGQQAYDRLIELRSERINGRPTLAESLDKLVSSDRYKRLPEGTDEYDSQKLDHIRKELGRSSEMTMRQLRKEIPELDRAIREDERAAKVVKRKGPEGLEALMNP